MTISKKHSAKILELYDWLMAKDRTLKDVSSVFLKDCQRLVEIKSMQIDEAGHFLEDQLPKKDKEELVLIGLKLQRLATVLDNWDDYRAGISVA